MFLTIVLNCNCQAIALLVVLYALPSNKYTQMHISRMMRTKKKTRYEYTWLNIHGQIKYVMCLDYDMLEKISKKHVCCHYVMRVAFRLMQKDIEIWPS